jgi:hypothetical protein
MHEDERIKQRIKNNGRLKEMKQALRWTRGCTITDRVSDHGSLFRIHLWSNKYKST